VFSRFVADLSSDDEQSWPPQPGLGAPVAGDCTCHQLGIRPLTSGYAVRANHFGSRLVAAVPGGLFAAAVIVSSARAGIPAVSGYVGAKILCAAATCAGP
jgi:hypothetical protein